MTEHPDRLADPIVVAGGGVGGLALALLLGRAGRRVTLVERDVLDGEPDPEAAFAGARRGVPQTHQTHGFLARLRLVLRDRLPDVLAEVEAAGAHTLALSSDLGEPRPGDDDLAVLIVRRTTLEWVLRRAVAAEPRIDVRSGQPVVALVTSASTNAGVLADADIVAGARAGAAAGVGASASASADADAFAGAGAGAGGAAGVGASASAGADVVAGADGVAGAYAGGAAGVGAFEAEAAADAEADVVAFAAVGASASADADVSAGAASAEPGLEPVVGIEVRGVEVPSPAMTSVAVAGAHGRARPRPDVPHVVGARLADGEVLRGTVVACTGSRGDVPAWLAELGVEVAEVEHQTKLIYLTRWYRLPADQPPAELGGRLFGDLGYLRYLVVPGDGGTLSATLAVHVNDSELRAQLLDGDGERFDRAVCRLPGPDRFFTPGPVEALGPVRPMAGLVNRLRRFVDDRRQPLVTGFHALGDAHTCTNPLYGRGCALAMVQAGLLADAFAAHPGDPWARAVDYEAASTREVEPWFHGSVQMDKLRDKVEARAARRRAAVPSSSSSPVDRSTAPREPADEGEMAAATFGRIMVEGGSDPVIGRAIIRLFNLLVLPHELLADAELVARVAPLLAKPPQAPPEPEGPTLAELLA